ncbi:MAG: aspartate aminotransferase family protein [Elusimicrobia bacterium]|nr:aspartate aminotransferase family protein [Elusimicrobiota bacterium]
MTTALSTWMAEEDRFLLPTYEKFPFVLERGEGSYVWDDAGARYLDFYGGHAVAILGHSPARVAAAVADQAKRLMFYSNLAYSKVRAEAARALIELNGQAGAQVFFCNSGAEANENAMRIARTATGRPGIVATEGSFHGRTAGALAATGAAKYRKGVRGLAADTTHMPFGDIDAAKSAITDQTAGVILEPIQSVAGVLEAPYGYLRELDALCRARGALLIVDEVQTGLGRLGARSAAELYGIRPQLSAFAKGLASGIPCGAVLVSADIASKVKPGGLGSTFGGGPVACAAALATLEEISSRKLWENAAAMEALIRGTFTFPAIREIRGKGLLLGLVLDKPSKPVRDGILSRGVLVGGADDPNVIRLLPPLTITADEVAVLREALRASL